MLDFNTEPYNDDYTPSKQFYRILYRPSFAVQARELTQMQSILQNQIKTHGDNIFKNGAMVIPGQASLQTVNTPGKGADYIKLISVYNNVAVETFLGSLLGTTVIGQTTGVTATVSYCQSAENTDPTTLYLNYTAGNGVYKTFATNEVIKTSDGTYSFQVGSTSDCIGKGSLASIQTGVYYINGYFVLCPSQTIVLDKYTATPTYRVGLTYTESIVTPESDETLLDNAQNSYNYAAPGAHRYMIDLALTKIGIISTADSNFVEVIRVTNGVINTIVQDTNYNIIYNQIEGEMQRRTYDTNGDYTVMGWDIDIREHRNNNRGTWTQNTAYIIGDVVSYNGNTYTALNSTTSVTTPPTHTSGSAYDGSSNTGINWQYTVNPFYNRGINLDGNENKLAIGIEAGKAYVNGAEIEKTAVTYIPVNKARDYTQAVNSAITGTPGNYVLVTNVNNLPPVDTFLNIQLYNYPNASAGAAPAGTVVGTARARLFEYHSGLPFSTATIYKLGLFDIQMTAPYKFSTDVKSFYYSGGSIATSFTADISPVLTPLIGSVTALGANITGTGTSFLTDLKVNDLILIGGQLTGSYRRVTAVSSQGTITVDSSITVTGATIARCSTQLLEPQNLSLIFPLPQYAIRSLRTAGSGGYNNLTYNSYQKFTGTASGSSITFSTTSGGTFSSIADSTHYTVFNNTTGAVIPPGSTLTITPTGNTVQLSGSAIGSNSITLIAVVQKSGSGSEKSKTLITASETFTTAAAAQQAVLYLDKADIFNLISVTTASGAAFGTAPAGSAYTTDITDRYTLDNGQRVSHYDWGSLILSPSFDLPANPIKVTYQYFAHGPGDYFDVNSYNGIDYKQIPPPLRDAIDFRPRVADRSYAVASAGSNGGNYFMIFKNFTQTGSSISACPKRGESITTDFSYYLARKDKIALDINGNILDVTGISAINAGIPPDPTAAMVLYTLALEPYTFSTTSNSVAVKKIDNKRYTMRDIGKLENRINNLEYYTSLSLLEQQTSSLKIQDSSGLDRMKNGFVVDNFTGSTLANNTSQDYYCAIDMENNQLRPFYTMYNSNLIEKYSISQRAAANYQVTGDIITLPYTTTPLITQQYASRLENINPFAIFSFLGDVQMNPPSDDWFETNRLPDIVQQVEGNYNTIAAMAQLSGALGTVWNAWQTEWIGATTTTTTFGGQYGAQAQDLGLTNGGVFSLNAGVGTNTNLHGFSVYAGSYTVSSTQANQVGQSRTGVNSSIALKTDYESQGDRVVSTAIIPYIRSRNILVQTHKLKPNTQFYPYFDGVDITPYCSIAQKLIYTNLNGSFDFKTNVGSQSTAVQRRIGTDSQVCLNTGDVITTASGASAVVVNSYIDANNNKCLSIVNLIGNIATTVANGTGDIITGSISGATATVTSITPASNFTTNSIGDLEFIFNIPNTDSVRFRTGKRELKLVDSSTYTGNYSSRGIATYEATGTLTNVQQTINAVRNAQIVQEQVSDNQTIYQTSTITKTGNAYYDPLAQSFLVQQKGGAFLTSVDVFFGSKDSNLPVTLQLREMVNGTPGKSILPFSVVTKQAKDVVLSANTVQLPDGNTYPTFDTPTTFTFETPVYVRDDTEYCFVLVSDSNNYKVWISYMGDTIPGSGRSISEQPYAGVMFKSQNASTWTADDNADIKFNINRAVFNTGVIGDVEFVNDLVPYDTLAVDPFETTAGSNIVRVWHYDHGMPINGGTGSTVDISAVNANDPGTGTITASISSTTITGVGTKFTTEAIVGTNIYNSQDVYIGTVTAVASDTSLTLSNNATTAMAAVSSYQYIGPINGIPANQIFKSSVISNVDNNCYTITTTANATVSGYTGGTFIKASRNIQYDIINPSIQTQSFPDTTTSFSIKTTSGKSVDGGQSPYQIDPTFTPVLNKENNKFISPRMISSNINEITNQSGSKSVIFSAQMSTTNDAVSPVIDMTRSSLIAIGNKLNLPTESNTNVAAIDTIPIWSGSTGAFSFGNSGTLWATSTAVNLGSLLYYSGNLYQVTVAGTTSSSSTAYPSHTSGTAVNGTATLLYVGSSGIITSTVAAVKSAMVQLGIGKYITVASATTSTNNGTFLVTGYTDDGTTGTVYVTNTFTAEAAVTGTTVTSRILFADEIAPVGSSTLSKYVTTPVKFANSSTYLRVMISANIPNESNVLIYYKSCTGDNTQLQYTKYTLLQPDNSIVKVDAGNTAFSDITYTLTGIPSFDTAQIKIVMQGTNTATPPIIRDFRLISCP
jgi:hypothetical protein